MSALQQMSKYDLQRSGRLAINLEDGVFEDLRKAIGIYFWSWFEKNKNDTVLKKGFLIFRITIKVKDLEQIFTVLFGPKPVGV